MEKLGVDVDPEAIKTASEKAQPTCPSCDRVLLNNVNVPTCLHCGTKPFEPRGSKA
jgi:ribosomal protein S27E